MCYSVQLISFPGCKWLHRQASGSEKLPVFTLIQRATTYIFDALFVYAALSMLFCHYHSANSEPYWPLYYKGFYYFAL